MARTTGRSGFKMRSGNASTFKMMGSSPLKGPGDGKQKKKTTETKMASYSAAIDSVTADMSDQQLREIVKEQGVERGKSRAHKWNVSLATLKKHRRTLTEPVVKEEKEVVVKEDKPAEQQYAWGKNFTRVPITPGVTPGFGVVDVGGVQPEHGDPTWYNREVGDPAEQGQYSNVNLDKTINIRQSDLADPNIMKTKNRNRAAMGMKEIIL